MAAPSPAQRAADVNARDAAQFDISSGPLADALDRFGDQSGLQVVYDLRLVSGRNAAGVSGRMRRLDALDRLLAGSGVSWKQVNEMTVMLVEPAHLRAIPESHAAAGAGR